MKELSNRLLRASVLSALVLFSLLMVCAQGAPYVVQKAWAGGGFDAQVVSAEWLNAKTMEVVFDKPVALAEDGRANIKVYKFFAEHNLASADNVTIEGDKATVVFSSETATNIAELLFQAGSLVQDGSANTDTLVARPPAPQKVVTKLTYSTLSLGSEGGSVVASLEGNFLNELGGWINGKVYEVVGSEETYVSSITPSYNESNQTFTFRLPANSSTADKSYKLKFQKTNWESTPVEVLEGADDVVTVAGSPVEIDPVVSGITFSKTDFKAEGGEVVVSLAGEALSQLNAGDFSLALNGVDAGIDVAYVAATDQSATATFTLPANSSTTDDNVYTFSIARGSDGVEGNNQQLTVKAVNTQPLIEGMTFLDQGLDPYHHGAGDFVLYYHGSTKGGRVKVALTGENLDGLTPGDFLLEEEGANGFEAVDGDFQVTADDPAHAVLTFAAPANSDISASKKIRFTALKADSTVGNNPQEFTLDHANENLEGKFRLDANKWSAATVANGVVRVHVDAPSVTLNPRFDDDKVAEEDRLDVRDYIFFADHNQTFDNPRYLTEDDVVTMRDGDIYIELADKEAKLPSWVMFKGESLVATDDAMVGSQQIHAGDTLAVRDENNHLHHARYIHSTPHVESIEYSRVTFTKEGGAVTATMRGSRLNESDPALWAKIFVDSEKDYSTEIVPQVTVNEAGDQAVATFNVPANNTKNTISYRLIPVVNDTNVMPLYLNGYDAVSVLPAGGKLSDITLSSVEIQGAYDLNDELDVFETSTSAEKFTAKIDVIIRGTNLSSKKTLVRAIDENGVVWPTLPVFECGATIRWQNSAYYLAERPSINEQHIELLLPRRLGVSHTFTLQFAPDGKNFLDKPTGTVIVENNGLFDYNDMQMRQFTVEDFTELKEVSVKYVDESGKELAPKDTYKGYGITEIYHQGIKPKSISGYTLKSYKPNNLASMLKQPIQRSDGDYEFTEGQYFFRDLKQIKNPSVVEDYTIVYTYAKNVDKSALKTSIKAAETASKNVKTSKDGLDVDPKDTYVTPVEASQLTSALANAKTVLNNANASQAQVDAAVKRLDTATNAYNRAKKAGKKQIALKSAAAPSQVYSGKALKPAPTVKDANGKTVPASAYTVAYANNIKAGTATVTATAKAGSGYSGTVKGAFKIKSWVRLAGSTALQTMASITREYGSAKVAVVATNADFKDSLAAAALAGSLSAPMLTTSKGALSADTKSELERMGVTTVYIVGSTNEVSANAEKQMRALSKVGSVVRVSARTPSERAVAAAKAVKGRSDTVVIATQGTFKDALAISPYAYATKSPILYAEANKKLSSATLSYIKSAGFKKAIVVGGPVALPKDVESQLASAGINAASITRLAGSNQYRTAQVAAEWALGKLKNGTGGSGLYQYASVKFQPAVKLTANRLGVARADDNRIGWKDALAGAALCGKNKSVLLLADKVNSAQAAAFVKANKASIQYGYVFGGTSAVPKDVMDKLVAASL